jgi:hypothetical protein
MDVVAAPVVLQASRFAGRVAPSLFLDFRSYLAVGAGPDVAAFGVDQRDVT